MEVEFTLREKLYDALEELEVEYLTGAVGALEVTFELVDTEELG